MGGSRPHTTSQRKGNLIPKRGSIEAITLIAVAGIVTIGLIGITTASVVVVLTALAFVVVVASFAIAAIHTLAGHQRIAHKPQRDDCRVEGPTAAAIRLCDHCPSSRRAATQPSNATTAVVCAD